VIESAGLEYWGADNHPGSDVAVVADFESKTCADAFGDRRFGTVLVLNVLEHVFEPITVLDNAVALTRPRGHIVTITPSMWPVHNCPVDCQRLLPDWYVLYAQRRPAVKLVEPFEFVGRGPVILHMQDGHRHLPAPWETKWSALYARAIN